MMPDAFVVSEAESHSLPADVVRAVEVRADVDSLGFLQAERRALLVNLNPLRALHGPGGKWDARRKSILDALKVKYRIAFAESGQKATDAAIDANAHADEQYLRFIEDGIAGHVEYLTLQNEYDDLTERIRSREVELICYNGELKLAR
jgi:hypothetical protein